MSSRKRYETVDTIRGFALVNMILYHAAWDLVYLFHVDWPWYRSDAGAFWQQCICWTFILLFMPTDRILFGILTLIGSCMLLMIPLEKVFDKITPPLGLAVSFALFLFTKVVLSFALRIPLKKGAVHRNGSFYSDYYIPK